MEKKPGGFVLIEVILASALFALLILACSVAILSGQEASVLGGNRTRAVFLAEEGLEAVRNIRDEDSAALTNGPHGLMVAGGVWTFSGAEDVTGIYTRVMTISDADTGSKEVTSRVTWQQNAQRAGEVTIVSRLSEWMIPLPPPPVPGP